jgi:hypothetical protein
VKGFKPLYGIMFFVALMLVITPWARIYPTNVFFIMSIVAVASYASGVWIMIALRDSGGTVIFMKDSVRKSRANDAISKTTETATARLPGLAMQPFGGFIVKTPPIGVADKSMALIPDSSIEQLSDQTTLVYSPTSPLKNARALKSVSSFFAKSAEAHPFLSFSMEKKSTSEVRIGLLNGLIEPITTEQLMDQERLINGHGSLVDLIENSEGGEDSNREAIQKMVKVMKKQTPSEKARSWVFGEPKPDYQVDRPSQREPNG